MPTIESARPDDMFPIYSPILPGTPVSSTNANAGACSGGLTLANVRLQPMTSRRVGERCATIRPPEHASELSSPPPGGGKTVCCNLYIVTPSPPHPHYISVVEGQEFRCTSVYYRGFFYRRWHIINITTTISSFCKYTFTTLSQCVCILLIFSDTRRECHWYYKKMLIILRSRKPIALKPVVYHQQMLSI
jgi:hypothetical protein